MAENSSSHRSMGIRFHPTGREMLKYLVGFVRDEPLPAQHEVMQVADLYADKEPWQIFETYDHGNNNTTRYFITPQKKEKPTWKRVSRTTGKGTWKPQNKGRDVFDDKGRLMGYVKSLKYIPANKSSNNVNGEWLMTEYSLLDHYLAVTEIKNKGFVICKIKKKGKPGDKKKGNNIEEVITDEKMREIEEFIKSVLKEDVQVKDNGIISSGTIAKNDQENMKYQVEDHQHATLWASAEDVNLDTINFF